MTEPVYPTRHCKAIGCNNEVPTHSLTDFCVDCFAQQWGAGSKEETSSPAAQEAQRAADFLRAGLGHMEDRARTYDNPTGERSMGKTVEMFNALTGLNLTEAQGWKFMVLLKLVRSEQGAFRADHYEDGAAYMGLAGEAQGKEPKGPSALCSD